MCYFSGPSISRGATSIQRRSDLIGPGIEAPGEGGRGLRGNRKVYRRYFQVHQWRTKRQRFFFSIIIVFFFLLLVIEFPLHCNTLQYEFTTPRLRSHPRFACNRFSRRIKKKQKKKNNYLRDLSSNYLVPSSAVREGDENKTALPIVTGLTRPVFGAFVRFSDIVFIRTTLYLSSVKFVIIFIFIFFFLARNRRFSTLRVRTRRAKSPICRDRLPPNYCVYALVTFVNLTIDGIH